ncbi:hypothetical protein B5F79_06085 [Olsenella sp. An285]|nr:hypothetical protein B5F79_06085 [Olsenella sp. An285]
MTPPSAHAAPSFEPIHYDATSDRTFFSPSAETCRARRASPAAPSSCETTRHAGRDAPHARRRESADTPVPHS